ncbi:MAG: TonB-dependent receptor [Acidobacteriota bacterium]|nr:TonB-dependent receptor [Acidobacteriota bacterium]
MKSAKEFSRFARLMPVLLVLLLLVANGALAQVDAGTILGTVKDQTGAVVPGVKVTLTNEGTGLSFSTVTNSGGSYTFTPIKIGTYTVSAGFRGFQKFTQVHVIVNVQQQVVVSFTLQPGATTQTVTVTAAPPQLQTQNASTGQVVGQREVNALPLNGRNYTFLAQLAAGVNGVSPTGRGLEASGTFIANGIPSSENNYILDGIDNNNDSVDFLNGASYAIKPPVDAIAEFKIQTSDFSAEFGRAGGAVLNATTKSGSNQLHGDAWEFLRNSGLDAANFFENASGTTKGEFRQNQFGFTVGGPVVIPKVYHGKDKTFFFFDYEGTRIRQAEPQLVTVPTTGERTSGYTNLLELITGQSGTRKDLLGRTFPLGTVFDPATTRSVVQGDVDPVTGLTASANGFVRDPFYQGSLAGVTDFTSAAQIALLNQLPAGRLDANAIKLLNLYPLPTLPGLFSNYFTNPSIRNSTNQFGVRIDHNFSSKDQMFGRVSYANNPNFVPGPFKGVADGSSFSQDNFQNLSINVVLSETHTFNPTTVNELRVGYSRLTTKQLQPFANTMGIPAQFGIQGIPQIPENGGLPLISISGLQQLGPAAFVPGSRVNDTSQLSENLTKIYSSHTFKGGFEIQHLRFPWFAPAYPRGQFNFNGTYTDVPTAGGGSTGLAQLLLLPAATTVPGGYDNVGGANQVLATNFTGPDDQRHYYGLYLQDDWKTTPKVTLNLGVRWEFFGQVVERYGAQANMIPGAPGNGAEYLITSQRKNNPLSPSFPATLAKDGIKLGYSSTPGLTNTPLNNFGPRFGVAWQPSHKLVLRGGYGLFYAGFTNIGGSPDIGSNYPFLFNFSFPAPDAAHPIIYSDGSLGTLETGLSGIPLSPTFVNARGLSLEGLQIGYKTPYTQEYNATIQYQLTPNQTFQVGYVGNNSKHLETSVGLNSTSKILTTSINPQLYVPFPDFGRGSTYVTTQGNDIYSALQVNFERRFSRGFTLLANYTWSKCRTDARDLLIGSGQGGFRAPYLPNFGVQGDYGLCGFNVPNIFHLSGSYQLPLGAGKHFLATSSGVANQIVGGWTLNWILTEEDGFPETLGCPIATTANFGCNALLVPGQNMYAGPHDVNQWLNPNAFANPPVATAIGQTDYAPLGGSPTQYLSPGFHRLDLSLFKEFRTTETTRLEFRTEFFNITNTPQFSAPAFRDFTNKSTFGRITSLRDGANDPRQIQFALKFYW